MNKYLHRFFSHYLRSLGYSGYSAHELPARISADLLKNQQVPFKQRVWALRRGFFANKISLYGLSNENYQEYLSDLQFEWLHPINGIFSQWIDDKLTYRYLLAPFARFIPEYYYHITKNEISRLVDCPRDFSASIDGILELTKENHSLACKPVIGTGGEGFYRFSYDGENLLMNHKNVTKEEFVTLINELRQFEPGYLISEYIRPHSYFSSIWGETPNALRVTMLKEANQDAIIAYALIRFGTLSSGAVDNVHMGGVLSLINLDTGEFEGGWKRTADKLEECVHHPNSGLLIKGTVPHWQLIKDELLEISRYVPQLRYMGFDIAVVDDGFKIIEINSLPSIESILCFQPIFKDEEMGEFFRRRIAEKKASFPPRKSRVLEKVFGG